MRTLPPGLQAHLDSGTTTLCQCWRVTLKGGERIGFTDHDRDVAFDGTTFEADAGFSASQIESSLGLSVDNMEAQGALSSNRLSEARIEAGDFDHAAIEIWRVNWQDVSQRVLQRRGHLGEVTRADGAFTAEIRGRAHVLNQQKGRLFQHGCDAELGDARCGVALSQPAFSATATVVSLEESALVVSGLGFADGWASRGQLQFGSGASAGRTLSIKQHRTMGSLSRLDVWAVVPAGVLPNDQISVQAGCDKQFTTCRDKFGNAVNFRGCPHMPGTDFVAAFATSFDSNNNGGKRT